MSVEEKVQVLKDAIANYFDTEPDRIQGFVIGTERVAGEEPNQTLAFSSAWYVGSDWLLSGYMIELQKGIDKQKARQELEQMMTGGEENGQI